MTDTAALREILSELEKAESLSPAQVGKMLCAFYNWKYQRVIHDPISDRLYIHRQDDDAYTLQRSQCPDRSLDAADALCREVLPGWELMAGRYSPALGYVATLRDYRQRGTSWDIYDMVEGKHFDNKCLAILITLVRAILAQHEREENA